MAISMTARIRVIATTNPKRKGTAAHKHFQRFRDGMSAEEFLGLGPWARTELRHSLRKGYITLEEPDDHRDPQPGAISRHEDAPAQHTAELAKPHPDSSEQPGA